MKKKSGAALWVALSGVVWSFSGLLSKLVSWSPFTLTGLRAVVAAGLLALARGSVRVRPNRAMWLSAAGVSLTSLLYMTAIRLTSSANAIVLQYTASVFVILYMFFVKKQRPLNSELMAACFVLLGVCLCFAGSLGGGRLTGDLIALLSGVTYACFFISARASGNDPLDGVYLGTLLSAGFAVFAFFDPAFSPDLRQLGVALALGLSLGLGYLLLSLGMRRGISSVTASVVSTIEPVMNPVWVFLALGESPDPLGLAGAGIVLLSVTLQSVYEGLRQR